MQTGPTTTEAVVPWDRENGNRTILRPPPVGGQRAGGDVAGGEVAGGDVAGGEVAGGDVAGGDVAGGEVAGGDVAGGDVAGGEVAGTDVTGGGGDEVDGPWLSSPAATAANPLARAAPPAMTRALPGPAAFPAF